MFYHNAVVEGKDDEEGPWGPILDILVDDDNDGRD